MMVFPPVVMVAVLLFHLLQEVKRVVPALGHFDVGNLCLPHQALALLLPRRQRARPQVLQTRRSKADMFFAGRGHKEVRS